MSSSCVTARCFSDADQLRFADLSGDRNPLHMPGLSARRAVADRPVVHGIHTTLWALESLDETVMPALSLDWLKVRFVRPLIVGERASTEVRSMDERGLRLDVLLDGDRAVTIQAGPGDRAETPGRPDGPLWQPVRPEALGFAEMLSCRGRVEPVMGSAALGGAFPVATRLFGAERVAGLCCMSYVVGMVCPGLPSIFGGLRLTACPLGAGPRTGLAFAAETVHETLGLVTLRVGGHGWTGTLDTLARA